MFKWETNQSNIPYLLSIIVKMSFLEISQILLEKFHFLIIILSNKFHFHFAKKNESNFFNFALLKKM